MNQISTVDKENDRINATSAHGTSEARPPRTTSNFSVNEGAMEVDATQTQEQIAQVSILCH